jgi:hypothetical protein
VNDGCHMQMCAWGKRSGDCRLRGASGEGTMVGGDGSMVATAVDHQEHRVRRLRILTQWTISNHLDRAPARFTFSSAVRIHHFLESPKNAIISQYHGSLFITASLDPAAQLYPRKSRVQSPTLGAFRVRSTLGLDICSLTHRNSCILKYRYGYDNL